VPAVTHKAGPVRNQTCGRVAHLLKHPPPCLARGERRLLLRPLALACQQHHALAAAVRQVRCRIRCLRQVLHVGALRDCRRVERRLLAAAWPGQLQHRPQRLVQQQLHGQVGLELAVKLHPRLASSCVRRPRRWRADACLLAANARASAVDKQRHKLRAASAARQRGRASLKPPCPGCAARKPRGAAVDRRWPRKR
jgi:hypothetical protein